MFQPLEMMCGQQTIILTAIQWLYIFGVGPGCYSTLALGVMTYQGPKRITKKGLRLLGHSLQPFTARFLEERMSWHM